jgi:hypothetical protein
MRKLLRASALTLLLAIPAWAGNIGCPVAPPPDGRAAQSSPEPAKTGEIGAPRAADVVRTLLQSLLALI